MSTNARVRTTMGFTMTRRHVAWSAPLPLSLHPTLAGAISGSQRFDRDRRARRCLDLYTNPSGYYAFNTYDQVAVRGRSGLLVEGFGGQAGADVVREGQGKPTGRLQSGVCEAPCVAWQAQSAGADSGGGGVSDCIRWGTNTIGMFVVCVWCVVL